MKKLFTILFLLSGLIAFSQLDQKPLVHTDKHIGERSYRDSPYISINDEKSDVLNETFEVWPPVDWEFQDGVTSIGTQHWHQSGESNMYAAVLFDNDGDGVPREQDEWLISPQITVPQYGFLKFQFHSNPYWMVDPNDNADVLVKISTDGTNWTELWNEDDFEFEYDVWTDVYIDLSDYESQNVQIAFQYVGNDACWFYIDNLRIYSLPEYDIEITDARINFFEIYDYHSDSDDFHYSSHYANIPIELLEGNVNAYLAFNALVINKGHGSGNVQCNVSVKDPDGAEIYNSTSYNDKVIGAMGVDTIDVAYTDEDEFKLNNPKLGQYEVVYSICVGEPGVFPIDVFKEKEVLTKTVSFEVTDKEYSRAADINDGFIGPKTWEDGGTSGDILTVKYMFFEDTRIENVKAFIHEDTDPECSMVCKVWQYVEDESGYVSVANSPLVTIDEEDIGTWKTFDFTNQAWVMTDDEYVATSVLVGFEFYYANDDAHLWLGCDKTSPSSPWGTLWHMQSGVNANQWYAITNFVGVPMIKLDLYDESGNVNDNEFAKKIDLYPNPTYGNVKLTGVENCKIEIINYIGSRIGEFLCSEDICNIDSSPYASGIYYIRITDLTDNNRTAVKKLNIMK